ncbi:Aste57867_11528 [Aphanomyces stellatus]|uniref:Aste57867_11528 protein n=1 Tax=Aphanomyces stellatus TaxID=120398 RepID=A0A485KTR4_9STRA|nr:hypothetical protein As57867_011485 [Aphanomyces stellatus]VFT88389.1 Aste57867_11528 [Aphanomyces stellatus]
MDEHGEEHAAAPPSLPLLDDNKTLLRAIESNEEMPVARRTLPRTPLAKPPKPTVRIRTREHQPNDDLSDVYFLVADFLRRATPCSRAAAVFEEELNALGLLRTSVNWTGDERPATYTDMHLRHRRLPPTQLVSLLRKGASGKLGLMARHDPVPSTADERRSALDTLIHLWRNMRASERKIQHVTLLLEKINLRRHHTAEPDEVDLVAEHRGAKQLVELQAQLMRDTESSVQVWKKVDTWGMTRAAPPTAPMVNSFHRLRRRDVLGRHAHPTPPLFVYSRFRKLKTLSGHLQIPVFCVTYDRSGKYIITGSDDRLVKIWSARTGDLLYTLHGHVGNITDMDINPSNGLLVTSSDDKTARVWEISTGFSIAVLVGHTSDVNTSRFHPVHNVVVSASDDGTCCIFRLPEVTPPTGPETKTETVHRLFKQNAFCRNIKPLVVLNHTNSRLNRSCKVVSLAFSPMGDVVVTGSQDGMGRVWHIAEFLAQATAAPTTAAVAVDDTEAVDAVVNSIPVEAQVSSANFVVQQRPADAPLHPDAENPHWANSHVVSEPLAVLAGHTQAISALLFNHKGDAIATASSKDGTSRLWRWSPKSKSFDKVTHTVLHGPEMLLSTRRASSELSIDQLMWTHDDSRLVTLHSRKPEVTGNNWCQAVRVWDPATCKPLLTLSHATQGHANAVFAMDVHPTDWRILLTAGYDGRIVVWNIETGHILRGFQNWESPTNTDGCAILDVSFSPSGNEFAATDRAGRLMLFGTGGNDALLVSPCEQYFSNDYAPIDLDTNLNVVDRETQVQPQLLPRSVLMDMGRNVYPAQPLHLMQPGLLSRHDYAANLELRRKQAESTQGFNSIVDKLVQEPYVDANFVEEEVLRPLLIKSGGPVHAYRLNGEAVAASELRRRRQPRAMETERDTSILNDVLPSSEDDDEDFQDNGPVEEDEDDDDDLDDDDEEAGSDELEGLDNRVVLRDGARALRSQRRRGRQLNSEDEDEEAGDGARNQRRTRPRRIILDEEETKDDHDEHANGVPAAIDGGYHRDEEEDLVVESSEGVTVSGNQRDKFDESKPYSQMFAQRSTIVCGFCGRGDQGGMFALPGALMGDFALVNGAQRVFVHDQCAISSPLSFFHDGSWYNVAKELRRGRFLKCFHCGLKGATIGCNTESCKVTIHLPCGMVHGYNVDKVQYYCKQHAAKSTTGSPAGPLSTESFIRRMGHQYDRTYCQQSATSPLVSIVPQVGDTVVYCPQGHAVFLRQFPTKFVPPYKRMPKPVAVAQCQIVDIQYNFPPVEKYPQQRRIVMQLTMDVVGLPHVYFADHELGLFDFATFVPVDDQFAQNDDAARPKWRFHIHFQPSECAEFLLLDQKFLSGFQLHWAVGETVHMPYHTLDDHGIVVDSQVDTGRIVDISRLDPAVASPWECIVVKWDNEEAPCRVSPWELEAGDPTNFVLPVIPDSPSVLQGLQSIRQLSVAAGFNEPVPSTTPDYHITIANPMDLELICQRVESSYYRQVDALFADVKLMVKNCETYNVESSLIAQNARSVLTNVLTLLNQLFPAHEWLPDVTGDEVLIPLDNVATLPPPESFAVEAHAAVDELVAVEDVPRHRPLKREHDEFHVANKRSTAEKEQKVMQQMRWSKMQREEFARVVARGKLVECLTQVHTHAQAEDSYNIFVAPVTDDIAPGYSAVILHPMDFATMKSKIPQYPSLVAYYDDYMLVMENALTYNQPGTLVHAEAKRMKSVLSKCFNRVLSKDKGKAKVSRRKYASDEDSVGSSDESSEDEEDEVVDEEEEEEEDEDEESDESEDDVSDDESDSGRRKKNGQQKRRGRR